VAAPAIAADNYPSKAITMVVGYPAGGSTDLVGRLVADGLAKHLGQPVVVENLGGAGGAIGAQKVAKALPTVTPSWWAPTMSWPLPGSSTRP
jgi:tripartite-type tricarboxylate transporter receptor subunit TctC